MKSLFKKPKHKNTLLPSEMAQHDVKPLLEQQCRVAYTVTPINKTTVEYSGDVPAWGRRQMRAVKTDKPT
jgi:hypothetical protein